MTRWDLDALPELTGEAQLLDWALRFLLAIHLAVGLVVDVDLYIYRRTQPSKFEKQSPPQSLAAGRFGGEAGI